MGPPEWKLAGPYDIKGDSEKTEPCTGVGGGGGYQRPPPQRRTSRPQAGPGTDPPFLWGPNFVTKFDF